MKGSEERVPQVLSIYSSIIQGREDSCSVTKCRVKGRAYWGWSWLSCLQEQSRSGQCHTFQCKSVFIKFRIIQLCGLGLTSGESLRWGECHQEGRIRGSKEDVQRHGAAYSKKQEKGEKGIQEVVINSLMSRSAFQDALFFWNLYILQLYSSVEKGELLFFLFFKYNVSFSVLSKL